MFWNELSKEWKLCFELAWDSYKEGSKPIAALITNEKGEIISTGKCAVHSQLAGECISCNEIAHAEINALLQIDNRVHTYRAPYTLYSTLEPCPLCMSALYMSGIKNLKYAAKDTYGGSENLLGATPYLSRKQIRVEGPVASIEEVSIILNAVFDIEHNPDKLFFVEDMKYHYPEAITIAEELAKTGALRLNKHLPFEQAFDLILRTFSVID